MENRGGLAIVAVIQQSTAWLFIVSAFLFVGSFIVCAIESLPERRKESDVQLAPEITRKEFDAKLAGWKEGPTRSALPAVGALTALVYRKNHRSPRHHHSRAR